MKHSYKIIFAVCLLFFTLTNKAQENQNEVSDGPQHPTLITKAIFLGEVPSIESQIASGTFKPAENKLKEVNPKRWGSNTSIPGKGLPKGNDPLWQIQTDVTKKAGKAPTLSFDAASASATPTDPTGAIGPNHFVNSWNTAFRIWDKAGNPLTAAASLGTVLPGTMGDPIVVYDKFADRFLITEFYSNGFDVAICKGPNPVTDGWWVYRFPTNTFPDYPKFAVWSDGYYITANKDQNSASTSQVVFAIERSKMLTGNTSAQMLGFPLTGIVTSGFYSPLAFNANGSSLPPVGNAPIVYMQDDAWSGVATDHLKIWSINVNWTTPASSTISSPQILNTQAFDGLFDGGSFSNLPQPSGSDIDALQATIMYMAQYRRFPAYNTVVFNFVVDLNGADNLAGIRWYELRQTTDGAPWAIYQEGTYVQPNGHSAFSGNMCMDASGNIALAYTTVSTTQYPSLRYSGRYAADPLGTMPFTEEVIVNGIQSDPSTRYGDYSQMTIDPVDDATFWSIGEYFAGGTRKNRVGVFNIAPPALTAKFTGTPTTLCTGGSVVFTDQSLGSPISWAWSFPGGTPSVFNGQTPPAISYNAPGTYDVTLAVTDASAGNNALTKTGYITAKDLIADFTGVPTSVIIGNTVTFTDNSLCNPTGWNWSFPGGTPSTSTAQSPVVTYSTLGIYDVSLTATKPGSTDTKTKTGYITVALPVFNMTNGTITTCSGDFYDSGGPTGSYQNNENFTETFYPSTSDAVMKITFTSFATESGYDFLKIYNGTSAGAPLLGTYSGTQSPGIVTASNALGALTFVFTSDGSSTPAGWAATISCQSTTVPPIADFTASTVNPPTNSTVTFTDQTANFPTSWAWSFTPNSVVYVGGTAASSQNPQVQFTSAGAYTVSLTASNAYGNNTKVKSNYINAVNCFITTFPWTEGFENGGAIPACWSQEYITTPGLNWTFVTGNGASNPSAAHTVTYNACLKDASSADNKTRLISPPINLNLISSPTLTFWHTQPVWASDQDVLTVFYRTSSTGAWTQLATYTSSITTWTQRTIVLPNSSTEYYINFEGNAKYGYGVCIDDVSITGTTSYLLSVTPANQNVTSPAGTTPFAVTTNAASWSASSDAAWCTVTPSGVGNGTLIATYTENTGAASRVANITVLAPGAPSVIVTVTQGGASPTLSVTPSNQNVAAPAGNTNFSVTSNSAWNAASNAAWCTVTLSGTGNGTIIATYTQNILLISLTANITVTVIGLAPVVVTVTQAAGSPTLVVTPANQNVSAVAGNTNFAVTSNTAWITSSNAAWCTVTPSGTGDGTIVATFTANALFTSRVATITVSASGAPSVNVTVSQSGLAPTLAVTPANQNVASAAGNTNFTVTSNSAWTVSSNVAWCTVTPSGTGNGTIVATYTENTSLVIRTANITVTVAGITPVNVAVTQAGTAPTLIVTPIDQSVPANAGAANYAITTNSAWTATSNTNWCVVTPSGTGNGTMVATYEANTSLNSRISYLAVSVPGAPNANLTLSQAGAAPFLLVTPAAQNVGFQTGTTNFTVSSNLGWTAVSDAPWCTITGSGNGSGTIVATFAENTFATNRIASITVTASGITPVVVTVEQSGPAATLSVTPATRTVTDPAGSTTFNVSSNTTWTTSSNANWCQPTPSGSGIAVLTATYEQNLSPVIRTATIQVSGAGVSPVSVQVLQLPSFVSLDENPENELQIFPNPTTGLFVISSASSELREMKVYILDARGKVILTRDCKGASSYTFDLSRAASGNYFMKIETDGKTHVLKVVVQ
jgi:PKD repeat protein